MTKSNFENGALKIFVPEDPLIFFHIPKTAGTTVSLALKDELGDSMIETKSQKNLDNMELIPPHTEIISGHFIWSHVIEKFPKANLLTMFRNPKERVISQYNNWRDSTRIEWSSGAWNIDDNAAEAFEIAQKNTLCDFLKSENDLIVANCRNVFTRAFCGSSDVSPYNEDPALVESAFENVRSFFWLGLVERMDLSMTSLAMQLGRPSLINAALHIHNHAKSSVQINDVGDALLDDCTKLDKKLYDLVESEFENRIAILLKEGAWSQFIIGARTKELKRQFHYITTDIDFLSGWSFEEKTLVGISYRWSFAGTEAAIMLPPMGKEDYTVTLHAIAVVEGVICSEIKVLLDRKPPDAYDAIQSEQGWLLRYKFKRSESNLCNSLLTIAVSGGTNKEKLADPRTNLGIALHAIEIEADGAC